MVIKTDLYDINGKKVKEIELPDFFSLPIREDIIQKVVEAEKKKQPYAPSFVAGKQASASGKIRHRRRKWKTAYGFGISRVPRKIFSRHGTRFSWEAATIPSARGGRRAHPPKIASMLKKKKINKKERLKAMQGAIASTASLEMFKKRYQDFSLEAEDKSKEKIKIKLPLVVESKIISLKTKQINEFLKKVLGDMYKIAVKKPNPTKKRGIILITGNNENTKVSFIAIKKVNGLKLDDLALPVPGRLALFTQQAIEDLKNLGKLGGGRK